MSGQHGAPDGGAGFTIIELMVTLFVASLFIGGFVTLTTTYNYYMALARQTSIADNTSYSYLQKYSRPDYDSTQWFTCNPSSDKQANPAAAGARIDAGTISGDSVSLPDPVSYTVTATAPYGCSGPNRTKPVRVDVTVTYGAAARSVSHSSYVAGAN